MLRQIIVSLRTLIFIGFVSSAYTYLRFGSFDFSWAVGEVDTLTFLQSFFIVWTMMDVCNLKMGKE